MEEQEDVDGFLCFFSFSFLVGALEFEAARFISSANEGLFPVVYSPQN